MMKKVLPLVLALAVVSSGCYGPFSLTKKLYKWNGDVGGKWVNEGVFLGMVILPVYFFATLGDAVIFNSIEFWGGKNPIQAKNVKSIQSGEEQAVLSYTPETKRLRVDSFRNGKLKGTVVFEPGTSGMEARGANGELLMQARTMENGQIVLSDAAGRQMGTYDPSRLPEMLPQTN
ncbi:MAG: DUF3332 family protein [Elusimicrobia bacterium]|nr:DUF3332 family protein [Elusimicrobiota bacterium]